MTRAELLLDFDGDAKLDEELLVFVLEVMDVAKMRHVERETARGVHHEIMLDAELSPLAIVALQAILGSDPRRETFNLLRALVLGDAPAFWQSRWNVLYAEKLGRTDTMINPEEFGQGKPSLKIEDIGDADVAVLTVSDVEQIEIEQDGETRNKLIVSFEEFPDKGFWCNVTGVKTLVGKLGNNEARWAGKQVPLVRATTRNPQTKKVQDVLWIADGDKWDDLIAQQSRRARGRSGAKKKAAKSRR